MALLHTILFLVALVCVCSTLKFSEPVCGGYCKDNPIYGFITKSKEHIVMKPGGSRDGGSFSIAGDTVHIETSGYFTYIYDGLTIYKKRNIYGGLLIDVKAFVMPGDILVSGNFGGQQSLDSALNRFLPLDRSHKNIDFWRQLLPESGNDHLVIIQIEDDDGVEKKEVPQEKEALPKKKPEKRKAEEEDINTNDSDDSTGKSPPKKKRKLSPNHPDFDIPEEDQFEKQPANGFSSDDSDTVEIPAEQYSKFALPKNDPRDIEIVQKERYFNYLLDKIPEDSEERGFKTRVLELEGTDEQISATAQVCFISPTKIRIIQTGGGVVIINNVQGIKNSAEMPFSDRSTKHGDVSKPIVLNDSDENIRIIDSYDVEVGDVIILLVPTSKNSTTKPLDWSFALIDSKEKGGLIDVQEHFNDLTNYYAKEGIKVLCAVVAE